MTTVREGGRSTTAVRAPRMRANKRIPPTLEELHARWFAFWRKLVDLQDRNGKPLSEFAALQVSLAEQVVLDLADVLDTQPCGRCPRDQRSIRKACPHIVSAADAPTR